MAFTVGQLIGANKEVITVLKTDSVKKAQSIMVEHQFSQLPVIDDDGRALGLISSDSILRTLRILGVSIDELRVLDAMEKTKHTFKDEDDLFDLLDDLIETYAVLIVDGEHKLQGIVTSYDTTQYFRQRSQDMMYAEDIETMLKDYINAYFTNETGQINEKARNDAIADIMPSNQELLKPFKKALAHYIQLEKDNQLSLRSDWAEQAFSQYVFQKKPAEAFDRLTQDQYITLFLHKDRWSHYSSIFSFDRQRIRALLENAKEPRNAAAHFRSEEITSEQREHLNFCREWLAHHEDAVLRKFSITIPTEQVITDTQNTNMRFVLTDDKSNMADNNIMPLDEQVNASDSRYVPLAVWLQKQSVKEDRLSITFRQIEELIADALPLSAHKYRSWWTSSNFDRNPQVRQWWEIGWHASTVLMAKETVVFSRIKDREKLYSDFFSKLSTKLKTSASFPLKQSSFNGFNWLIIASIPKEAPQTAFLGVSFARRGRFRVELYIDSGDKTRNKAIFNALYQRKSTIMKELTTISGSLEWERIDDKRASRIALYRSGTIGEKAEKLAELRTWATEATIQLHSVMEKYVSEVVNDL